MNLQERINKLIKAMSEGIYGRDEVIRLSLLSTLSGQSIFLLGPPGVAKSLIARRLKLSFKGIKKDDGTFEDVKVFEYLMGKFSTPDEVFGPLDINKLTDDKGTKYERIIDKYLPGADIVFLDEIWKASPAIQNSLLTIINEKKFLNGDTELDVPLKGLIAASNELPQKDQGLEALWDRFIIREYVDYLNRGKEFRSMIRDKEFSEDDIEKINRDIEDFKINEKEYKEIQKAINDVEIPDYIFDMADILHRKINEYNANIPEEKEHDKIIISDRRWKKIFRILRTSAHCNGCEEVNALDFFLVEKCINQTMSPDEMKKIHDIVKEVVRIHGKVELKEISEYEKTLSEINNHIFINQDSKNILTSKLDELKLNFGKKQKEIENENERKWDGKERTKKENKKEKDVVDPRFGKIFSPHSYH